MSNLTPEQQSKLQQMATVVKTSARKLVGISIDEDVSSVMSSEDMKEALAKSIMLLEYAQKIEDKI